ncbi:MAG TPA: hypothetical protein VLG50_03145 [Candidatus Saccharimonadales bacterium]|nr:hypothetical protein [Candidatus Saccharimonadales bacterium]
MKQKHLYQFMLAAMVVLVVITAWEDGINMQLFKLIFAMWLLERFAHCQMFHHSCRV